MAPFDEKIDELLAKHLAGECSAEEETAIGQWLEESPLHQKHFEELRWLWQHSEEGRAQVARAVDTEAALQQVKQRLRPPGKRPGFEVYRSFRMRAAAAVLLLLTAIYWWQSSRAPAPVEIAAVTSDLKDTLADGSVVALKQRSGLTLAANFNRRERRMRLHGEAFFQVAPDTARPFIVEVLDLQVRVVGTAFYVDNVTDPAKVVVSVSEGKVRVSSGGKVLLLNPGEGAVYERQTGNLTRIATQENQQTPATSSRILWFDATPLADVIGQVNKAYGVNITLKNNDLEKCPLTARYNNLPLERVLELIADSFSITVEKTENGYMLDGKGCEE
ncbi:MAG: FecR domain-containing protein [Lewinellaceae bacterium]|nr:FecR domain-containing protein [Lewinellaceae bacterium]